MTKITTFKDLYEFLQNYSETSILPWLKKKWKGKDKQESLLRLFAGLGLINKLNNYNICKGNFNIKTIEPCTSIKDIFYNNNNNLIKLKDKGDSSDLTGIHKENDNNILITTSKNLKKLTLNNLDIDKIFTYFSQYNEIYTMTLCIVIRDIKDFRKMYNNIEKTSSHLQKILKEDTIIIDWNDLDEAFNNFKNIFTNINFKSILGNKSCLCLKMHQVYSVLKTIQMKNNNKNKILWGHIQRSGKSYIIGGCIIKDSYNKDKCNYLVITTAPNETIIQYIKVFDCIQLQDFNIIFLNGKNKKPKLTNKNIIICSKQFLQTKLNKLRNIKWLREMIFEMRFIDESHNGGTTKLAKNTLNYYGNNTFTIQITATYSKPINDYNIPRENWILWDLEDIKLCKNISKKYNRLRLKEKHGKEIIDCIKKYTTQNIIKEYSKYPELWLLTDELNKDIINKIKNITKKNNYGWSTNGCFLLDQGIKNNKIIKKEKFQNEKENLAPFRILQDEIYQKELEIKKRIEENNKPIEEYNISSRENE